MFSFISTIFIVLLLLPAAAQAAKISGFVQDDQGAALSEVQVSIPALKKTAQTGIDGKFQFDHLEHGVYSLEFKRPGYSTLAQKAKLLGEEFNLSVRLQESVFVLPTLTVTAKPQPSLLLTSPQSVSVLQERDLTRRRGQSALAAIQNTPGAATFTTGANVVKPVVRGLTSQRVLIVENGVRQEDQQWGEEHDSKIDALDVDRIEVLRGAGSLLYGSDALGGVVNITRAPLPSSDNFAPRLGGRFSFDGFTANRQGAGALSLFGAQPSGIGYRAQISRRQAGNLATPAGDLKNSGLQEYNGSASFGIAQNWGSVQLDASHVDQDAELPQENAAETPFQRLQHDKLQLHLTLLRDAARFETVAAYQVNGRKEFENKDAAAPALNLWLRTATLDVKAHHHPVGDLSGTFGLSLLRQNNQTLGEETLIPGYDAGNLGVFVYEELPVKTLTFSAGARGDWRRLDAYSNEALSLSAQTKHYSAFSGALGAVWQAADPLAFALNLGRGFRAPTAFELFSNGVHEGSNRYEVGDANLKPEESFDLDASVRYASGRIKAEATFFRNQIQRFVYSDRLVSGLNPVVGQNVGETLLDADGNSVLDDNGDPVTVGTDDGESGAPIYLTRQADAVLLGGEFALQVQATDWLLLRSGFDLIRGTNEQLNQPLPFIPANRVQFGARLQRAVLGALQHPYFDASTKLVDTQNRLANGETATAGYTLFDLALGAEIEVFGNTLTLDLGVDNVLDRAYVDHLNRLKSFAQNSGRNFYVKVTIPFDIVK